MTSIGALERLGIEQKLDELLDGVTMIEKYGIQTSGSVKNIPFDTSAVWTALKLSVSLASKGTIRATVDSVNEAMIQILKTMWVVDHPDAISPSIIGELQVRDASFGEDHDWEAVHNGNTVKTVLAKT